MIRHDISGIPVVRKSTVGWELLTKTDIVNAIAKHYGEECKMAVAQDHNSTNQYQFLEAQLFQMR